MRGPRRLGLLFAAAASLYLIGVALKVPLLAGVGGILAFGLIAGYLHLAGGAGPAHRALLAGLLILAIAAVLEVLSWRAVTTTDGSGFRESARLLGSAGVRQAVEEQRTRDRWQALSMLLAAGCFCFAVARATWRERRAMGTAMLAMAAPGLVVLLAVAVVDIDLLPLFGSVLNLVLAALVAIAAAAWIAVRVIRRHAGRVARRHVLLAAGVTALAFPIWSVVDAATVSLPAPDGPTRPAMAVVARGYDTSSAVSIAAGPDLGGALRSALSLAGAALITIGALSAAVRRDQD